MPVYGFESEDDIRRVIQGTRDAERLKRSPAPGDPPRQRIVPVVTVRVTGPAGSGGFYPGQITHYIAEDAAWVDDYECRVMDVNGAGLVSGTRYRGEFISNMAPGANLGYPIILVSLGGGLGGISGNPMEVVVDVACTGDGILYVAKALGQTATPLQVGGRVVDVDEVPVNGHTVTVTSDVGGPYTVNTNSDGYYLVGFNGTSGNVDVDAGAGYTPASYNLTWTGSYAYFTHKDFTGT